MGDGRRPGVPDSVNERGDAVTLTVNDVTTDADAPSPQRRRWPWIAAGVVVVLLVATGISGVVYAHTYSPLGPGNWGAAPVGNLRAITDGVVDPSRDIIVGSKGSTGTMGYSISNNGHHAIRILGSAVEPYTPLSGLFTLTWSPVATPNGEVGPDFRFARSLPVTIAPHQQVILYATFRKPKCISGETNELYALPIRTEALWVHHVWNLTLASGEGGSASAGVPVDVCSPRAALKHLSHGL
jgi:hypothetical protein